MNTRILRPLVMGAAALVVSFTGASCSGASNTEPVDISVVESGESSATPHTGDQEARDTSTTEHSDPSGVTKLGETFTWEDGLAVTLGKPVLLKDFEYPDLLMRDQRAYTFKVTVKNGTSERYDPSEFFATASSGEDEVDSLFDSANKLNGSPDTVILPGQSRTWLIGFPVTKGEGIQIEVSPTLDGDYFTAIFVS